MTSGFVGWLLHTGPGATYLVTLTLKMVILHNCPLDLSNMYILSAPRCLWRASAYCVEEHVANSQSKGTYGEAYVVPGPCAAVILDSNVRLLQYYAM